LSLSLLSLLYHSITFSPLFSFYSSLSGVPHFPFLPFSPLRCSSAFLFSRLYSSSVLFFRFFLPLFPYLFRGKLSLLPSAQGQPACNRLSSSLTASGLF
jgi:hypothetical protein